MVGPIMNLISEIYSSYERREYAFMILREYTIISLHWEQEAQLFGDCLQ